MGGAAAHDGRGRDQGAGFNAARGFVGGAARRTLRSSTRNLGFNAARGFVGGAAGAQRKEELL